MQKLKFRQLPTSMKAFAVKRRHKPITRPYKSMLGPFLKYMNKFQSLYLSKISKTTVQKLEEVCEESKLPKWIIVDMALAHFLETVPQMVAEFRLPEDEKDRVRVWTNPRYLREKYSIGEIAFKDAHPFGEIWENYNGDESDYES